MKRLVLALAFLCAVFPAFSQADSVLLWPNGAPGAIPSATMKESFVKNGPTDITRVSGVQNPTITVFLPPKETATGAAVVICPGGGYWILAIEHEGYDVAKWFNSIGVAAFVLKYRLPKDEIMQDKTVGPLMDVQQAIKTVRQNAKRWNVDPDKVGVMGFSAGGHLASTALTHFNENPSGLNRSISARPDFGILIYPVTSFREGIGHMGSRHNLIGKEANYDLVKKYSNELQVTADTPPTFLVHSTDDKTVPVECSLEFYQALRKFNIPAEMHIYLKGGHGYGMGKPNTAEASWPKRCEDWMRNMGWIK